MDKSHKSSNVDGVRDPTMWRMHPVLQNTLGLGFMPPFTVTFLQLFLKSEWTPILSGKFCVDIRCPLGTEELWALRDGHLCSFVSRMETEAEDPAGLSLLIQRRRCWTLQFPAAPVASLSSSEQKYKESALVLSWKRRLLPNISLSSFHRGLCNDFSPKSSERELSYLGTTE